VALTRTVLLGLALATGLASGCAGRRPALADIEDERERSIVLADGVSVRATRWDRLLVVRAAEEMRDATTSAQVDRERSDRLHERYAKGTVFTVLLELTHRETGDDPLADPDNWWFRLERDGRSVPAQTVEVLAVDRFPTGAVQRGPATAHLRIALRVAFAAPVDDRAVTLRLGTKAKTKRRFALGRHVAKHGARLRWPTDT
jgi:hypothetical protein